MPNGNVDFAHVSSGQNSAVPCSAANSVFKSTMDLPISPMQRKLESKAPSINDASKGTSQFTQS